MGNLNLRVKELSVTLSPASTISSTIRIAPTFPPASPIYRECSAKTGPLSKSALNNVNGASAKLTPMLDDLRKTSDQAQRNPEKN